LETSRTFGTLLSDPHLRQTLLHIHNDEVFKNALSEWATKLAHIGDENSTGQRKGPPVIHSLINHFYLNKCDGLALINVQI